MTRFGTCHFVDKESAIKYYKSYCSYCFESAEEVVDSKISQGEIKFGPPLRRHDELVFLNQEEGRYFKEVS